MSLFLIETSAWVSFLRGDAATVQRVDPLLAERRVAINGPIYAELLSGALTREIQNQLKILLRSLHWIREPSDIWDRVAEARFTLARQGHQATLVDVMIAISAAEAGAVLLTRDRDFERISLALPLTLSLF